MCFEIFQHSDGNADNVHFGQDDIAEGFILGVEDIGIVLFIAIKALQGCAIAVGELIGNHCNYYISVVIGDILLTDVDDIAVDLSFGNSSSSDVGGYVGEDGEVTCLALYLCNGKYSDMIVGYGERRYADYTDIDGLYFVREIAVDDYNENYDVKTSFWSTKYDHTERIYIPRDMLELSEGYICISVVEIVYYTGDEAYGFGSVGIQGLKYEMLEDGRVKLSEPNSSHYSDPK